MVHLKYCDGARIGWVRWEGLVVSTLRTAVKRRWERMIAVSRSADQLPEPRRPWRLYATLLGGGLSGLWLADRVASSASDQSAWWVLVLVAVIGSVAVSAICVSLFLIVTESQSHANRVFCSRSTFGATVFTLVMGSLLTIAALRRNPFHHILATGRITGGTIVDFGLVLGVAAFVIGAIAGAFGTVDAIREERRWGEALGITHP